MINQHRKRETRKKKGKTKHHSRRVKKKKNLNSRKDHLRPSKLLEFHSRQIHLIKQCGTNLQITILRCRLKLQDQQSNKSATLCGIIQQIPNKHKIILHISNAIGQWRRRWSTDSPHPLHIKHHSRTTKCLFLRLSIVKILPKAAVQEKKATRGGTFDCHTIKLMINTSKFVPKRTWCPITHQISKEPLLTLVLGKLVS